MRRNRAMAAFSLLLAALMLLSACSGGRGEKDGLLLYYTPADVSGGSALVGEPSGLSEEEVTPQSLMTALLSGPADAGLRSPIPQGVELLGMVQDGGCVTVDLSERYGGLSDMELTLADYAITLTLCQLPGVESVRITAAGGAVSGRAPRELRPDDLLLSGEPPAQD